MLRLLAGRQRVGESAYLIEAHGEGRYAAGLCKPSVSLCSWFKEAKRDASLTGRKATYRRVGVLDRSAW